MIITPAHTTRPDVQTQGGKGASLLRLQAAGYPVPPFVIIPSDGFTEDGNLMPGMLDNVKAFFSEGAVVAVRSSAAVEDHAAHSFAGQFATKLNVPVAQVEAAVKEVWHSGFSAGVATYKKIHSVDAAPQMAVVVQQMVQATASGVAFGINPLTGNAGENVINAVLGLGEGLVNGSLNADTYTVSGHGILKKLAGSDNPVLTDGQIHFIANLLDQLQQLYGTPQDIEFAYEGDAFYLLQSRPVTTLTKKETIIWDNSNIVESYPGLTLPLTFSFIQKCMKPCTGSFRP
jgi:phosphoenolpyruvate synthase/pyruvate phosphate dikinase